MTKLGWGFVGTKGISERAAREIGELPDASLRAICSRSLTDAENFCRTFQVEKAYTDYQAFLADPKIQIVYLGVPHCFHHDLAKLAMERGKAVLCEKPLAVSVAEVKSLIETSARHRVFLMEGMWTRFLPVIQRVKSWLVNGAIGSVEKVEASFCFKADFDPRSRLFSKELAGGALLDVGVYPLSITNFLLDDYPTHLSATGTIGESGVDESNELVLSYKDGAKAILKSAIRQSLGEDMVLHGSEGRIEIPFFWRANEATLFSQKGKLLDKVEGPDSFCFEALEVMAAVREQRIESAVMSHADSLRTAEIVEDALLQIGNSLS